MAERVHGLERTIFSAGSIDMARFTNSLSRNGTRASKPQADVDLFALKQSYRCSAFNCPYNRNSLHQGFVARKSKVSTAFHKVIDSHMKYRCFHLQRHSTNLPTCFFVKLLLVGGFVEVEVTPKYLV
jgi:hypothetical protein